MADEVTLYSLILEVLETGEEDDNQAATKIVDLTLGRHRKAAPAILHALIADEVRRVRRNHVRDLERTANRPRKTGTTTEAADPIAARAAWLAEGFYIPSKGRVNWGDATCDDHRERVDYLNSYVAGVHRTIHRHELAVKLIEANDAMCLSDIEGVWDLEDPGDTDDDH